MTIFLLILLAFYFVGVALSLVFQVFLIVDDIQKELRRSSIGDLFSVVISSGMWPVIAMTMLLLCVSGDLNKDKMKIVHDPYDECAKCGKFHYSHEAQWLNPKDKHSFVSKKVLKEKAMKIYYVYNNDMDCTGDTIISLHLTQESALKKIESLMKDLHPGSYMDYFRWDVREVEE